MSKKGINQTVSRYFLKLSFFMNDIDNAYTF